MKRRLFAFLFLIFGSCLFLTACDKGAVSPIDETQCTMVEESLTYALEVKQISFDAEGISSEVVDNSVVVKYNLEFCNYEADEVEIMLEDVDEMVKTIFDSSIAEKSLPSFELTYLFDNNTLIYTATLVS